MERVTSIELTDEERERIVSWFGCYQDRGYDDEIDENLAARIASDLRD